ncbi:hypothetical protein BJ875DRAFT_491520 [Amylocarpus encephaloides]|uniref:Uncharacterized protein n=1 Tax=Amylocarpus encephaloides TaxID=45428 RepID=A0A9P8CA21_9HELO|nr:hypothetical protein BJ875DRAFT_491520 [Amylocarpus encephaloides]
MASPSSLYGIRKPKIQSRDISSSTSLAFSSTLSTLLSTSSFTSRPAQGRPRPSKTNKNDIFTSHNKNTKKRAAKDLEDDDSDAEGRRARGSSRKDIGTVDDATLHRSKRKMAAKAKMYKEMKRRDYIPREGEEDLIDFDRKWVERDDKGEATSSDSDSETNDKANPNEAVEYEDEYGRLRRGTKLDAARMERRKNNQILGQEELDRMSARPSQPSNLIYGDTVQTLAFNPDEDITAKMDEIAAKRDRSMTPPEMRHYEAEREFRVKGTGFYSFSKDEETRMGEMEGLKREREETERVRRERAERVEGRRKEIEERRRVVGEKRARKQAENFLEGLGKDLG